MWALIEEGWEELCEWAVFFARRLQLARNPDLAITFAMLNYTKEGGGDALHCETSPHDNDWALKLEVPKGAESPLDPLLTNGNLDTSGRIYEGLRAAEAKPRPLGRANALVARSLLQGLEVPSLEGESATAVALQATGWVAWVDRCLQGEGSLLNPPRLLPFGAEALPPLRPWLEALPAGLATRAAALELQRSLSRSLSQ
jgi:hypothetical protein